VGRKNIELSTMEEAFTSEHWIVRIFKVLKRCGTCVVVCYDVI
jgi:hypothetical protein